jgi:D-lactate dehydrogenase
VDLRAELSGLLAPDRVLMQPLDLAVYACDASFYRLVPRAVVRPASIGEVQALFDFARRARIPLTFRAAGTSLSGQAVTDGIVVDISRHWRRLVIEDHGLRVRVQPGVIGGFVNRALARHGTKLGPDPASIDSCMIGGILSNNSSGMCCGTEHNAYRTVESLTFVLPSGLVVDSAAPGAAEHLAAREPSIARGLRGLRERIERHPALSERIRAKYRVKNTMGYSINAFVDFSTPLEILQHLLIGSEGTLAFLAEAVFRTIPDLPLKSTGLLFFPDIHAACASIPALRDTGAAALEVMDRASLRSVEGKPGVPALVESLPEEASAILAEYQARTEHELAAVESDCRSLIPTLPLLAETGFTRDPARQAELWVVRKGLTASVGAMRPRGTSMIMEDVTFPLESLAEGVLGLQALFRRHGYPGAIVFGHARDGNLHFLVSQSFNDPAEIARYEAFTEDLVELVVRRHDGALKSEHGTGRNMAPFVEAEWGAEAYAIMQEVKALIDPDGILNPGVILNPDPRAHLTHLKTLPEVADEVDRCIECGFCESRCPSRDLTVTPRQRIAVLREQARLRVAGAGRAVTQALEEDAGYAVLDTCAADGLCATACPVGIDVGRLVKRLRGERRSARARRAAVFVAEHFETTERLARWGLAIGRAAETVAGPAALAALGRGARRLLGRRVPVWPAGLPGVARPRMPRTEQAGAQAVYFPSCVTRVVGPPPDGRRGLSLAEVVVECSRRAGVPVWLPERSSGQCCGMPFSSKGFHEAHERVLNRLVDRLWEWSAGGRIPVVMDTSPCAFALRTGRDALRPENRERLDRLRVIDGIEFAHDALLPRLPVRARARAVALHPVCSAIKLGIAVRLKRLAEACARSVFVPPASGCCGFAGDRGLWFPELTESATRAAAEELHGRQFDGYYSSSRTCEIGMSRATGRPYRSFWYLLEEATRG